MDNWFTSKLLFDKLVHLEQYPYGTMERKQVLEGGTFCRRKIVSVVVHGQLTCFYFGYLLGRKKGAVH
eukprot:12998829-Ditylum_brightwellii.AAC.1